MEPESQTDHVEASESEYADDSDIEHFRAGQVFAVAAVKSAMILNGAAAIALLAYVGNLGLDELERDTVKLFSFAFIFYILGALVAAFSAALGFLVNSMAIGALSPNQPRSSQRFRSWQMMLISSIISMFIAFASFAAGAFSSFFAIF